MRTIICASFVVALLNVAAAGSADSSRDTSPTQTLVFERDSKAMFMQSDGSSQRRAPFGEHPRYSPNGRRVLFYKSVRLFAANADGSDRQPIAAVCFPGIGDWSPDGEKVAYYNGCDIGDRSIWVVDRHGKHRRRLTALSSFDPRWSPDGRVILFTGYPHRGDVRLFLMDADGRNRHVIRGSYPSDWEANYAAQWSRNGRRIFFLSQPRNKTRSLFVMNRDGTDARNLTPSDLGFDVESYSLSPDERWIAVDGKPLHGNRDIYVVAATGGPPQRLTTAIGADERPAWSNDGTKIAFESNRDGNTEIYLINADGSGEVNLTKNPAYDSRPVWVPPKRR